MCGRWSRADRPRSDKQESKQAKQTPLHIRKKLEKTCVGVSCAGVGCGRGGWVPWYSGAGEGTVRTGRGCRRIGHCEGEWNNVGELATAVYLGRFGRTWQRGLRCMLLAGGKLLCTEPEGDTDVAEPWKMRLGCRLLRHRQ